MKTLWASYQYVLYGMGFKSDYSQTAYALDDIDFAQRHFAQNKKITEKAISTLPKNRELINKVIEFGFNRI